MLSEHELSRLIEYASKAPSGHNTQPWRFVIKDAEIQICPDFTRSLPVVDTDKHELYISLGCAVENIVIAASQLQYDAAVSLFKRDDQTCIRVRFDEGSTLQSDELFSYIKSRQATRNKYTSRSVPDNDIEILKNSFSIPGISARFFLQPQEIHSFEQFIIEGNTLQFNNKKFIDELLNWFSFSRKEAESRGDGLWSRCMGFPDMGSLMGKFVMRYFVSAKSEAKRWQGLIQASAGIVMFLAEDNTPDNWINLGRAFQRFGLAATKQNINLSHMNMPCEETSVREKMVSCFNLGSLHPLLLIRIGYSQKMPYSFRRPTSAVID